MGVVHKDLKPANLVVDPATSDVRIIDFGLASRLPRAPRGGRSLHRDRSLLMHPHAGRRPTPSRARCSACPLAPLPRPWPASSRPWRPW
ncbi:MAG TPA: hypothetical protein VEM76_04975 [Anaeromyxobacteraceae bacterium]|nr:hypothetical protein [Anaeromyxobacteraceae bacterium]